MILLAVTNFTLSKTHPSFISEPQLKTQLNPNHFQYLQLFIAYPP